MKNQLEKLVLTESETLTEVVNCLVKHIPINSTGAGNPESLFQVLSTWTKKQNCLRRSPERAAPPSPNSFEPSLQMLRQFCFFMSDYLVRAASKQDTIENTSKEFKKSTCGNNIRYHLGKISNFEELEIQLNSALKSKIPKGLPRPSG